MAALRRTSVDAAPLPVLWKAGPVWSKADVMPLICDVRFTPESGHECASATCPVNPEADIRQPPCCKSAPTVGKMMSAVAARPGYALLCAYLDSSR